MEFRELPTRRFGTGRPIAWADEAATLRERAERDDSWGVLTPNAKSPSFANNIRHGLLAAFQPAGSFEATSRKNEDGTHMIYARYVGGAE